MNIKKIVCITALASLAMSSAYAVASCITVAGAYTKAETALYYKRRCFTCTLGCSLNNARNETG